MVLIKRLMHSQLSPADVLMKVLDELVEPLEGCGYRLESQTVHGVAFARGQVGILELSFFEGPEGGTSIAVISDGRLPRELDRFRP
jgi:hypothetical protein